jgi:hypothetical protein
LLWSKELIDTFFEELEIYRKAVMVWNYSLDHTNPHLAISKKLKELKN